MKNFTHILFTFIASLLLFAQQGSAAVNEVSDIYGQYVFTAKIELTDAGKSLGLADVLKEESAVTISQSDYFPIEISGLLGSSEKQLGNKIDMAAHTLNINNPNGNGWIVPDKQLCMALDDGKYSGAVLTYTFDTATGVITIPDFILLQVTIEDFMSMGSGTLVAKVTDAKLTPEGSETPGGETYADLSSEWRFVPDPDNAWSTMPGSALPATFTMTLATANAANSAYKCTLAIEGIDGTVELDGSFDGKNLICKHNYAVFGDTYYYLADINDPTSTDIYINLQVADDNTLELKNGFYVCCKGEKVQYYYAGTMTNAETAETHDFTGEYEVTIGKAETYAIENAGYPATGEKFRFTIEEKNGVLYVTKWMGLDTWTNSSGTATARAEGNRLYITSGQQYQIAGFSDDYTSLYIHVLASGNVYGNPLADPVVVTANEDGTLSIDDFIMLSVTRTYTDNNYTTYEDVPDYLKMNWYTGCTIVKYDGSHIEGTAATATQHAIYNISGMRVTKPASGLYIINGKKTVMK